MNKELDKKIESLLNEAKNDLYQEKIDENFINNLKFKLKDDFKKQKQRGLLLNWLRKPIWGGILAGVIVIAVVLQPSGVNELDAIEVEDNYEELEARNEELKTKPAIDSELIRSEPGTSKVSKLIAPSTSKKSETSNPADQDDEDIEEVTDEGSEESFEANLAMEAMPAPALLTKEKEAKGETTYYLITEVTSIKEAAGIIKKTAESNFGQVILELVSTGEQSGTIQISIPARHKTTLYSAIEQVGRLDSISKTRLDESNEDFLNIIIELRQT